MNKKNKKSIYMWILLVILALYLFFFVFSELFIILNSGLIEGFSLNYTYNLFEFIFMQISLIFMIIFTFKLFYVKKDLLLWVHIFFAQAIILNFISKLLLAIYNIPQYSLSPNIILYTIVYIVIWVTFYLHLKKLKKNKKINID